MKKLTALVRPLLHSLLCSLLVSMAVLAPAHASSEGIIWDKFDTKRLTDLAALQNGAKLFANYCMNCHAAAYMRYNRLRDIGLSEEQIKDNLIFTGAKVGETMKSALDPKDAKDWFGGVPPDLTLIARSRSDGDKGTGADYIYTYLRSYYRDDTKATGWNNLAFPSVAMPHVLWEMQGQRAAKFVEQKDAHDPSKTTHVFAGFEQLTPGSMSSQQFDDTVADLVGFLQWMSEPAQGQRTRLGVWVLIFLAVFTVFAWRLSAAYWRDVK